MLFQAIRQKIAFIVAGYHEHYYAVGYIRRNPLSGRISNILIIEHIKTSSIIEFGSILVKRGDFNINLLYGMGRIEVVLLAYDGNNAVACAGLKRYSDTDVEIKRVWVEPEYRGKHIAQEMMEKIENKAREFGYKRTILQTREIMKDALGLYEGIGYSRIENYPPYDTLPGAICMAKEL